MFCPVAFVPQIDHIKYHTFCERTKEEEEEKKTNSRMIIDVINLNRLRITIIDLLLKVAYFKFRIAKNCRPTQKTGISYLNGIFFEWHV